MVVVCSERYNFFINDTSFVLKDYNKGEEYRISFNFRIDVSTSQHNPFVWESKIVSNKIKGIITTMSYGKGFVVKLNIENIFPSVFEGEFYISSSTLKYDDLRECLVLGNGNVISCVGGEIAQDKIFFNLGVKEKKEILIYVGDKDLHDAFLNDLDSQDISKYHDPYYWEIINRSFSNISLISDNESLNDLLNVCKIQILSSVKINPLRLVDVDDDAKLEVLCALLDMDAKELVKEFIKLHVIKGYAFLYLLKRYVHLSGDVSFGEEVFKYASKVRIKDDDILSRYLYSNDVKFREKVISFISDDVSLQSHPYKIYAFLRVHDHTLPESIKEYSIRRMMEHTDTLLHYIELNDYPYLLNYFLTHYDVGFASVVLMKIFKELIYTEIDNLHNKIKVDLSAIKENKVYYKEIGYEDVELNIIYDRERKKIEINTHALHPYDFEIYVPSADYEVYVNKKLLFLKDTRGIIRIG